MKDCSMGGFIGGSVRKSVSEMRRENHARVLETYRTIFGEKDPLSRTDENERGNVFPIRPKMDETLPAANDR